MRYMQKTNRSRYDPRIKVLQIILTSGLGFSLGGRYTGTLLFIAVLLFALYSGMFVTGLKFTLAYAGLYLLAEIGPLLLATMLQFFFMRVLTIAFSMLILYRTTDITEMITSFQNLHIPQAIILPVAMIMRFLPSIQQDVIYIKQGMKTRGIAITPKRIFYHPGQIYEGFLVPILMRILMTSTELAASAETRGISYPCLKTHYRTIKFRITDTIILVAMLMIYSAIVSYAIYQPF